MQLQECLLRQVLRLSHVADHAQAKRVNATLVQAVKLRKGLVIASLGARQHLGFRCIGSRGGWERPGPANCGALHQPRAAALDAFSAPGQPRLARPASKV